MKQITTTLTQRGQLTIPVEVQRLLGVKPRDRVTITIDGDHVSLSPARFTIESVRGSVAALPGDIAEDFDRQIADAMDDEADRIVREMEQP